MHPAPSETGASQQKQKEAGPSLEGAARTCSLAGRSVASVFINRRDLHGDLVTMLYVGAVKKLSTVQLATTTQQKKSLFERAPPRARGVCTIAVSRKNAHAARV